MTSNTTLPTVMLRAPSDRSLDLLRHLQMAVLKHPVASQAIFSALVEEGKAYAQTPPGKQLYSKLSHSELVARARMTWESVSLWLLDPDYQGELPSELVDAFFSVSNHQDLEPMLEQVFAGFESKPK